MTICVLNGLHESPEKVGNIGQGRQAMGKRKSPGKHRQKKKNKTNSIKRRVLLLFA